MPPCWLERLLLSVMCECVSLCCCLLSAGRCTSSPEQSSASHLQQCTTWRSSCKIAKNKKKNRNELFFHRACSFHDRQEGWKRHGWRGSYLDTIVWSSKACCWEKYCCWTACSKHKSWPGTRGTVFTFLSPWNEERKRWIPNVTILYSFSEKHNLGEDSGFREQD